MDDFTRFEQQLQRWEQRRRLTAALLWLPRGLLAGLLLALVVALMARLYPSLTNSQVGQTAVILGLVGVAVMLLYLLAERRSLEQQAQFADRQFALQERALTAVQLADGRLMAPPGWAGWQLAETLQAMSRVNLAAALPLRLIRQELGLLAVTALLLGAAVILPNPQTEILAQQAALQAKIDEQISTLEALIAEIEANPELTPEQQAALTQPLEAAVRELEAGSLSRAEALAALAEAELELRELAATAEAEAAAARQGQLAAAAAPLLNNPFTAPLGEALQAGDLSAAADALSALAEQLGQLSPEELAALAAQLAQMAALLDEIDPELAGQLAAAAAGLNAGDLATAQAALENAGGSLAAAAAAQASATQAQAAAAALSGSRQEVAQGSGSDSAGQNGDSGPGQSNGPGQTNGDGPGLTGAEQGGVGGVGEGGGPAGSLYIPDYVDLSAFEGVEIELPAECRVDPAACGPLLREWATEFGEEQSRVPYYEVFRDYRQSAYEALNEDYIPLGLQGLVRDYFSSLEPSQR